MNRLMLPRGIIVNPGDLIVMKDNRVLRYFSHSGVAHGSSSLEVMVSHASNTHDMSVTWWEPASGISHKATSVGQHIGSNADATVASKCLELLRLASKMGLAVEAIDGMYPDERALERLREMIYDAQGKHI